MKKEQFIELCKNDPEEVYKLFCIMGETITTLQAQVVALNEQVNSLQAEVKELKSRLEQNSKNIINLNKFGSIFLSYNRSLIHKI